CYCYGDCRHLHSFPTRRSSDLILVDGECPRHVGPGRVTDVYFDVCIRRAPYIPSPNPDSRLRPALQRQTGIGPKRQGRKVRRGIGGRPVQDGNFRVFIGSKNRVPGLIRAHHRKTDKIPPRYGDAVRYRVVVKPDAVYSTCLIFAGASTIRKVWPKENTRTPNINGFLSIEIRRKVPVIEGDSFFSFLICDLGTDSHKRGVHGPRREQVGGESIPRPESPPVKIIF